MFSYDGSDRRALHAALDAANAKVASLSAENERLREAAELSAAINRAATVLPWGMEISIVVEQGSGWVDLHDGDGHKIDVDDDGMTIAQKVNAAISAALSGGKEPDS